MHEPVPRLTRICASGSASISIAGALVADTIKPKNTKKMIAFIFNLDSDCGIFFKEIRFFTQLTDRQREAED